MKLWKNCPDCWGTGLVGGFQAPCSRFPDLGDKEAIEAIAKVVMQLAVLRIVAKATGIQFEKLARALKLE